ncbi:MAG TPA: TonB-dependent receptor plug domain-containing protein, partial [Dongiaceae bacterium]|nr:TonB-dependent receptor plug domain-containing protein [Dongiaceae bacterium]
MPQHNSALALRSLALAIASVIGTVQAEETTQSLPLVEVTDNGLEADTTDSYTTPIIRSATRLDLSVRETPQSISVVTQQQIKDQGANTVSDALRHTTGISVKSQDRARNEVMSRGFEVNNYQIDNMPISKDIESGLDTANTAIYDRIEIVRGATGLVSGAGDPSATINLVRKRANSLVFTGSVDVEAGSWDRRGATADISTPVTADGSVRTRLVGHFAESDSFVDLENTENSVFYGVVEADLSEHTRLTVGGSYEKDDLSGIYWGSLPFFYADGSRTDLDQSTTTAADWNHWTTEDTTLFASLEHTL